MKIAVYCGSDFGKGDIYKEAASELGRWIGANHHTLIYGGGEAGLMGTVAREVFEAGQQVIGVIPGNVEFIKNRPQPYVTNLITYLFILFGPMPILPRSPAVPNSKEP